jgi:hypothetical protein
MRVMRFRFISLHHITGLNLDEENDPTSVYEASEGALSAYLTSRPDLPCELLDKSLAISRGLFTGMFRHLEDGSFEERLRRTVDQITEERRKTYAAGVFLISEGCGETPRFETTARRDAGAFVVYMGGAPKEDIVASHRAALIGIQAAIELAFDNLQGITKLGETVVFFEEDGRPGLAFNFEVPFARATGYRKPDIMQRDLSRTLVQATVRDRDMSSVFRLLNQSFDVQQDSLRRFLAAWMALEVFVNKTFPTYEADFWDSVAAKLPSPVKDRYIRKINDVMQSEYKILDKFVVVSGKLVPEDADEDYKAIRSAQKLRNDFSHGPWRLSWSTRSARTKAPVIVILVHRSLKKPCLSRRSRPFFGSCSSATSNEG